MRWHAARSARHFEAHRLQQPYYGGANGCLIGLPAQSLIKARGFAPYVNGLAGSVAVGHVIKDRAVATRGPGRPLELKLYACLYGSF
jgi:hypothetical protein